MGRTPTLVTEDKRLQDIQRIIRKSGIPYSQIARDSGVSYATLNAWMHGRRAPRPETLDKVAAGFRARAAELERSAQELADV